MALALCIGSLLLSQAGAATVGKVFVSYTADGSPRYASQRLDASYRIFIRGESVPGVRGKEPTRKPPGESSQQGRLHLTPLIEHYARVHKVRPELVAAVVGVESGFNASAVSPKGARGAMQLMPATAARYGVTNPEDPAQNIDAGVRHLNGHDTRDAPDDESHDRFPLFPNPSPTRGEGSVVSRLRDFHIKDLLSRHQGNVALALAAYNAGQGAVARHGSRIPPYRETMLYVPAVLSAAARGDTR